MLEEKTKNNKQYFFGVFAYGPVTLFGWKIFGMLI